MNPVRCPNCGRHVASESQPAEYRYLESGLPDAILCGGVTETNCAGCGETCFGIDKEWQVLQAMAIALITSRKRLTGPELRYLRRSCRLMQADLAKLLHHRRATVAERELKRDPKLSEAEEMWFRIAIVGAFRRYLKRPGRCYLSRSHLRSLTTYARSFCETAISPTKREFQRTELRMHFAEGEWAWEWEPVRKAA